MIVLVDNYDSFTYNLYQALAAYDADIRVLRNDAVNSRDVKALCPDAIVFPRVPVIQGLQAIWRTSYAAAIRKSPCSVSVWDTRP